MIYDSTSNTIKEPKCLLCNCKKSEDCQHDFVIGRFETEPRFGGMIYQKVGYAVCRKCGKIVGADY